jgi:hypothetical protein
VTRDHPGGAVSRETGHLVLSTLHTTNATETINRIIDFFPPFQHRQVRISLAAVLRGVISQRLVPRADGVGRVVAVEAMVMTGRISDRILDPNGGSGETIEDVIADGEYHGMVTFDQSLFNLFKAGEISLRAALQAATNPHDFRVALQTAGLLPIHLKRPAGFPGSLGSHAVVPERLRPVLDEAPTSSARLFRPTPGPGFTWSGASSATPCSTGSTRAATSTSPPTPCQTTTEAGPGSLGGQRLDARASALAPSAPPRGRDASR